MLIYLAARYERREELCRYRDELQALGHVVTSRWLSGSHLITDEQLHSSEHDHLQMRFALEDVEDLESANMVISFTESPDAGSVRGGRHVEFGIAWEACKVCLVVGYRENIFHSLPSVTFFPTWGACLDAIAREWVSA